MSASPLSRLAVLVVDDNVNMSRIIKTIVKGLGVVHLHEAPDVAEALIITRQFAIDIVFLDYQLGFMDGLDFVRMIRTAPDSPNPYLPIVMVTGYTELHRVEAARDAGANEFCAKPVTAAELFKKIATVVEHPRPFVRTNQYFGPDRRRRAMPPQGEDRRKSGQSLAI
ncbi:MAG: two-component system response regulator [Caulobacterales bacterium 32-69-10]|nr:MAG: two-component system response regulator [Caulobacterales bacterium 32-69-10]